MSSRGCCYIGLIYCRCWRNEEQSESRTLRLFRTITTKSHNNRSLDDNGDRRANTSMVVSRKDVCYIKTTPSSSSSLMSTSMYIINVMSWDLSHMKCSFCNICLLCELFSSDWAMRDFRRQSEVSLKTPPSSSSSRLENTRNRPGLITLDSLLDRNTWRWNRFQEEMDDEMRHQMSRSLCVCFKT